MLYLQKKQSYYTKLRALLVILLFYDLNQYNFPEVNDNFH